MPKIEIHELNPEQVFTSGTNDSGSRCLGVVKSSNGSQFNVLLERNAVTIRDENRHIALEGVPTDDDINRFEEARTLKIAGVVMGQQGPIVAYTCPHESVNLHDLLLTMEKPSADVRRQLGSALTTGIRSLYIHYNCAHMNLRTQSFVFFKGPNGADLTTPYILDWWHKPPPSVYMHPERQGDSQKIGWVYDIWSLLMILSEVAEWKPIGNSQQIQTIQVQRKKLVTDLEWKGESTAKIMRYGFGFIEKDRQTLENLGKKEIKRFFDELCKLFETS